MDFVSIAVALVLVAVAAVVFRRRRTPAHGGRPPEPLRSRREQPLARPLSTGTPRDLGTMASTSGRGGVYPFTADSTDAIDVTTESPVAREFPMTNTTQQVDTRDLPRATNGGRKVQGSRVEFYQPTDGTLQFVPGRLEVVEGEEQQRHEIRFVRQFPVTAVTFGRNSGEPYTHIQLHSRTVSRLHARMEFEKDSWSLTNLSKTNPTVLNGEPLAEGDETRVLQEGDKIEMGEVIFCFKAK